jgi:hypothetical protein
LAGFTENVSEEYPPDAHAPDGALWWTLSVEPGTRRRFGQERRLAAWLWFAKELGETFTLPEARDALGPDLGTGSQHFDRRLRRLREVGWIIPSGKDGGMGLRNDEYRLDAKGAKWWIPEERKTVGRFSPSPVVRRRVFERDGHRCALCGVGQGEAYPGEPGSRARLTIGHRVPQERLRRYGQRDNADNWRTECARCNETVRDAAPDPHTLEETLPLVNALNREQKARLFDWLERGERVRDDLDRVHDQARMLSAEDRARMLDYLKGFAE